MPHAKSEIVRRLYRYTCGYCGITETDVGSEMTVDHFMPRIAGGGDDLDNLVYACWKCNQLKHDFCILHPLLDDISIHLHPNEQTGLIDAITETGRFHVATIRLNRPQLVKYRLGQQLQQMLHQKQQLLELQIDELRKTIVAQERYLAALQAQIHQLRSTR
jgi:HNH endonuclease